ncbi:terpene synthase family protein [Streptomyces beigongshangae]|uniref:terpene synthase family protein n=1 Tax=Streptomyces beigongshangae TaxID=2841597 RepID=UPI001C843BDA|nr:terpene synthase family protein [Streptomyces sp. REN17]
MMSPRMASQNFDQLAYPQLGTCYSFGATREGAQILADLTTWFFLFDDQHDRYIIESREQEWRQLYAQLTALARDPTKAAESANPVPGALADILLRTAPHFSTVWWDRFARHWANVFAGYDQEFDNRTKGQCETIDDYVELRRCSVAMIMWMDLVELAAQAELPPDLHRTAEYQECIEATVDYCAWCNDLHSLAKESAAADTSNIVTVIDDATGCGHEAAIQEALRMMAARVQDFLTAEAALETTVADRLDLPLPTRQGLHRCLMGMRDWIANMDGWHRISDRYLGADPQAPIQAYNEDLTTADSRQTQHGVPAPHS